MGTHHTANHPIDALVTPLIDAMEAGHLPWLQPWQRVGADTPIRRPRLGGSTTCQGLNTLLLWQAGAIGAEFWLTETQAAALGLTLPVDAGVPILRRPMLPQGNERVIVYRFAAPHPVLAGDRAVAAIRFLRAQGAEIGSGAHRAFYSRMADRILVPRPWNLGQRTMEVAVAPAAALQAYIHWARHPARVQQAGRPHFLPDASRTLEMLVAAMGASLLCAELGLIPMMADEEPAFLAEWVRILRADPRIAIAAAAAAQDAVDFLIRRAGPSATALAPPATIGHSVDPHSCSGDGPR